MAAIVVCLIVIVVGYGVVHNVGPLRFSAISATNFCNSVMTQLMGSFSAMNLV